MILKTEIVEELALVVRQPPHHCPALQVKNTQKTDSRFESGHKGLNQRYQPEEDIMRYDPGFG